MTNLSTADGFSSISDEIDLPDNEESLISFDEPDEIVELDHDSDIIYVLYVFLLALSGFSWVFCVREAQSSIYSCFIGFSSDQGHPAAKAAEP